MSRSLEKTIADPRVTLKLGDHVVQDVSLWSLILISIINGHLHFRPDDIELYLDGVRVDKPFPPDDDENDMEVENEPEP